MKKIHFQKELLFASNQQRGGANSKKIVEKIQSWLTLYEMANSGTGTALRIDGDFGPATEAAVKIFQQKKGFSPTGVVDSTLFDKLTEPLQSVFTTLSGMDTLRQKIVKIALNHLEQKPFELIIRQQSNSGPWVRSYMDGSDGAGMLWCMGFSQAILGQAASEMGKDFRTIVPQTDSCDEVAAYGISTSRLIKNIAWRANPSLARPGDIFLIYQNPTVKWYHAGIIISVTPEYVETIEGNTNEGGSNNGIGVYRRIRNFHNAKIDVFSVEDLV
jgi:hypothetical protein